MPNDLAPIRPRTDRLTWAMFATYTLWGWVLYMFGPASQLLGTERGLTDTLTGLHGTAMAAGTVLAGLVMPRAVPALGRRRTLMAAAVLIAVGVTVYVASPSFVLGLAAVVVMSVGGSAALGAGTAGLVLHHGATGSATALATGNGLGTVAGIVSPLVLGAAVGIGFGWRAALLTTVPLAAGAFLLWSATVPRDPRPLPSTGTERVAHARLTLGADAWLLLLATVSGTALEFATTFWAATLLEETTGATAAVAAASTSGLVAGMALSRLASGPATRRWGAARLVAVSFCVAGAGWAVLWTASTPAVAIAGLVVAGLGVGLTFPLGSALFLAAARGPVDTAQAVVTVAAGVAIGAVPFALGALADRVGVHAAFLVVPVFAVVGLVGVLVGARTRR